MIQTNHAKKDRHISSKLEQFIQASGKEDSVMDLVSKCGLMAPNMLVSGGKIELMVKENSSMLMVTFMTVSGLMIRPTVLAFINTLMAPNMKACGRMIYNMVRELRPGQINHDMRAIMRLVASMV